MDESHRISGKSSFIGILERFDKTRMHEVFRLCSVRSLCGLF